MYLYIVLGIILIPCSAILIGMCFFIVNHYFLTPLDRKLSFVSIPFLNGVKKFFNPNYKAPENASEDYDCPTCEK